jgi:DNA-binding NarL/FixJ family response regulator
MPAGWRTPAVGWTIATLMAAPQVQARVSQHRRARVLAVDDHPQFLALLRELIGAAGELEPVGEASSGEDAIEVATELQPDLVLMDVRMPGLSGIEAARRIKAGHPSMLVILISSTHPDELALTADVTAADAVLWKGELAPRALDPLWLRHRIALDDATS